MAATLDLLPAGPVTLNHLGMAFPDVPRAEWRSAMRSVAARPDMALFIASDDCDFTTGSAFNVDGGIIMT